MSVEENEDKGRKLNWKQASRILGCGKTHFYALVNSGQLTAYRSGAGKRGMWVWEEDCRVLVRPVGENSSQDICAAIKMVDAEKEKYKIDI